MEYLLEIDSIRCGFGQQLVVDDLSLGLRPGSMACLLGPSGCGKTTVLRAVAGFEPLLGGEIRLAGQSVSRPGRLLPPEQRGLGMVFQDYALFPHLRVGENVAFGLRGRSRAERRRSAAEMLELVGLTGYGRRYPHELSGGQQQRVAVARALAPRPRLLLLDEPFSNLDVELRERLAIDIRNILKERGIASLFVTHDQHEAFVLGEQIGVMHGGRILQWDTPFNIYHEPANRFVADFIGQGRLIPGVLAAPDTVETALGRLSGSRSYPWPAGSELELLLRPDDLALDGSGHPARVVERAFKGAETLYTLRLEDGTEVLSLVPSHQEHPLGAEVRVRVVAEHLILFPRSDA
jgi:iron(III) transport system ATP-binding protein